MDLDTVSPDFHKDFPNFDGHDGFSRAEMENYFKNAGFTPINYEILWNGRNGEIDFRIFLMEGKKMCIRDSKKCFWKRYKNIRRSFEM